MEKTETYHQLIKENKIHPNISVDCVIFGFDFEKLNVLLVERELLDPVTQKTLISDFTLAGNHVFINEELEDAAARVLFDLTGMEHIYLEQFGVFASPYRLTKEKDKLWHSHIGLHETRIISIGFYSLVDCNKVKIVEKDRKVAWHPVEEVNELAFDHDIIIKQALKVLRDKLRNEPVGFELLPEKFTLTQLQKLYEVILGLELDKRNFRKRVAKMKYLVPLNEKQKDVPHKPARFYVFDKDAYEKSKRDMLYFSL